MNSTTISQSNYSIENDSHITFIEAKIPYRKNAALYCLFLLTSLTISIITYVILNRNIKTNLNIGFIIMFVITSNASVWIMSKILILYFLKFLDTNSFLKIIIEKKKNMIEILITCFISCYILKFIETEQNLSFKCSEYFIIISICIFFILLRIIMGEGSNYLLHLNNYYKKLNEIEDDMNILFIINSAVSGQKDNNIYSSKKYIKLVFKTISPDLKPIDMHILRNFFNSSDTVTILNKFDIKKNNKIPLEQFVNVWSNIVSLKKSIKTIVEHKDNLLHKLDIIFMIILFPFGLFLIMSILGNTKHLTAIFTIITGCFFSLSFVFGPVIGDLFKSIIFIFLVKPFEVGDIIEFDGLTYVVEEPGLMYSTLKHDSLMTMFHNNKIMDKNIINYRISEFIEKNYEFRFNIYFYKNNINIIKQSIKKLLRKYSYTFEEKFFLNNIHLLDNNNIIVCIKVKAHLHSVNYEEEIDKFGIELSQLINNIINLDQENTNINLTKMSNSNILNIDENKENMIVNDNLITSELKNEDLKKINEEIKKNEEDVEEI